ncbi:MAG: hypothetical protein WC911_02185 [Thermoleophilia bacterium]
MFDLEPIEKRLAEATPGPWAGDRDYVIGSDGYEIADVIEGKCISGSYLSDPNPPHHWANTPNGWIERPESESDANTQLIAHAPEDLRACIEEIKRLRKVEEVARQWIVDNDNATLDCYCFRELRDRLDELESEK